MNINFKNMNPFSRQNEISERFRMNDKTNLVNIAMDNYNREPAPIISVSVGSAGMRRTALWRRKMDSLNCSNRIQSMIAYDCNRTNVQQWVKAANASNVIDQCILPNYLPFSEGFLRQPNSFIEHYGPIERDLERIIDEMEQKASESGIRPQLIIEWIGFGGHARISYLFHEMIVEHFRGARILPVYCIPDDRILEQNIRKHRLWDEAQEIIGTGPAVITDNRISSNLQTLDERVAIALSATEACYQFRPEYGTMAETVSTFELDGSRWIGLQISDIPYRTNFDKRHYKAINLSKNSHISLYESREAMAAVTAHAQSIKEAIWKIAAPENDEHHTGYLGESKHDAEQRIYCLLPFHPDITNIIKEDVEDQLQRETFNGPYPGTKVCFASGNANYSNRPDGYTYGHICKIYGMNGDQTPPSLMRVLDPNNNYRGNRHRVLSRGEDMMQNLGIPFTAVEKNHHGQAKQMTNTNYIAPQPSKNGDQREPAIPSNLGTGAAPLLTSLDIE